MERIWLEKSYPPGVPHDIDADKYASLAELFFKYSEQYADKPAYINMDVTMTYGQLRDRAKSFASYLQHQLGMKKGDKLAIMVPNTLQYPIALFGGMIAGITIVNVNPLYTARELKHQLSDADVTAIVIIENFAHTLQQVIADTPVKHVILTSLGDRLGLLKGLAVNLVVRHLKKMVPAYKLPGAIWFNDILRKGQSATFEPVDINGGDLAFLQYTGGTTGVSKGAMLTHRNMVANLEQAKGMLTTLLVPGEEMIVTALPLYHIFALTANCLTFFTVGGCNLLITNPRDMQGFVKELSKYRFTVMTGVNTLYNGLLQTKGFKDLDFSGLKVSLGGGMAVQRAVAEQWQQVTKTRMLEGYGLTECAPMVTISPYNLQAYDGTVGVPAPSTQMRIVDEQGRDLGMNEPGEILVKGPQVMKGYYQRAEATAEVLSDDGWLSTGDIGLMDERGFFSIVDRKKDMIIVSGFNVYPNEIEDVVVTHPGISECAAVGIPHEVSGEIVKVFVTKSDNKVTEKDVINHCKANLTGYKVPKVVEFRDDLPKSNVGKILRRQLR
ncbi:AMP-binding protein [Thalassotalea ponticola]|uniref:AMP-binding protein n=1 Tax=Thalassotalea ponticola TaxID=1523392 RepID=UPI0025B427D1|nr:AMP-binding protein [Thalassotalea ponticola]MDN3651294.1 AMP-binding protein [Thalassotalea ponticola]